MCRGTAMRTFISAISQITTERDKCTYPTLSIVWFVQRLWVFEDSLISSNLPHCCFLSLSLSLPILNQRLIFSLRSTINPTGHETPWNSIVLVVVVAVVVSILILCCLEWCGYNDHELATTHSICNNLVTINKQKGMLQQSAQTLNWYKMLWRARHTLFHSACTFANYDRMTFNLIDHHKNMQ